jgi:predicted amidophosphoribosyltransferase
METLTRKQLIPIDITNHFSGFAGGWYLVDYIPATPDKISLSIINYKLEFDNCVRKWNELAAKRFLTLDIKTDIVIRALTSHEVISNNTKPLDYLCHAIARATEAKHIPTLLQKRQPTAPMHRLNYMQRQKELKDIYFINPAYRGEPNSILIIDDIITSGATMNAIKKALLQQFPQASLYFFALGRTISRQARQQMRNH